MTKEKKHKGYIGDLSEEQQQVLDNFKTHVTQVMKINNPRFDDRYFLRFCRARKFELEKVGGSND
jgi:hypothetical protein